LGTANPYASTYTNIAAAGYYAPAGSVQQLKCPRGMYQNLAEQSSCKKCEAGQFCGTEAMTNYIPCPVGYYCPAYQTYVDSGTYYDKVRCPAGTYNPNTA
jgi:Tyrosine-protein kinase ephrin type A/B receptor-like